MHSLPYPFLPFSFFITFFFLSHPLTLSSHSLVVTSPSLTPYPHLVYPGLTFETAPIASFLPYVQPVSKDSSPPSLIFPLPSFLIHPFSDLILPTIISFSLRLFLTRLPFPFPSFKVHNLSPFTPSLPLPSPAYNDPPLALPFPASPQALPSPILPSSPPGSSLLPMPANLAGQTAATRRHKQGNATCTAATT